MCVKPFDSDPVRDAFHAMTQSTHHHSAPETAVSQTVVMAMHSALFSFILDSFTLKKILDVTHKLDFTGSQLTVRKTVYYTIFPATQNEPDLVRSEEENILGKVNSV